MGKDNDVHIRGSTKEENKKLTPFQKNLKRFMTSYGLTQVALAKQMGIRSSTISQWLHGVTEPRGKHLEMLANIFNCYKSDLMDDKSRVSAKDIPIYDPVSCGKGAFIDENVIDYISLPSNWININSQYFANEAEGDSMEPLIKHGELLIFEKTDVVPVGRIGAFSLNGEYYCKRLKRYKDGSLWLFSDNEDYAPIPVKPEDDFRFLGFFRFKASKVQ